MAFPVVQWLKNPSAMEETWVRPLGQEDPLEEGMETHSNILAWRIPWTEEPDGQQFMWLQRVGHTEATYQVHMHTLNHLQSTYNTEYSVNAI